jgi:hypothetical protein
MNTNNRKQIVGYILAALMLFALLNSAWFFLFVVKLGFFEWLAFNACSLSIITYLVCYALFRIKKKDFFIAIALVPLYYYGTMGLFLIPWNSANMFAQVTHVIITLNFIWILIVLLKESKYESLGKGLTLGVLLFVPVFAVIQNYSQLHMAEFMQMLQRVQL